MRHSVALRSVLIVPITLGVSVLAGVGVSELPPGATSIALATLLLVIVVSPMVVAAARGRFDVFEPINAVMVFLGLMFVGQVYVDAALGQDRLVQLFSPERTTTLLQVVLTLVILGTLAFLAGYYLAPGLSTRLARALPVVRGEWSSARLRHVLVAFSVIGVVAFLYFMKTSGGVGYFVTHLYQRTSLASGRQYILWAFQLFVLATLVWFTYLASRGYRVTGRWLFWVQFLVASTMTLMLGGRGDLLYIWEVMLVIHHYLVRPLRLWLVMSFAVIAFIALALIGAYRQSTASGGEPFSASGVLTGRGVIQNTFHYDYSPLSMFMLVVDRVPDELPLRWGGTFANVLYQPIPRALFPDKPKPLNTWYNQKLLGAERGGKKASVFAEGFINFHVPGILGLMFLYGVAARAIYIYLQRHRASAGAVLLYALFYKYIWSFTGGGFDELTVGLLIRVLPVLFALHFAAALSERRSVAPRLEAAHPR